MSNQTVSHGSTVSLKLEVLNAEGKVIETSDPENDLNVVIGDGALPPSVEEGLVGAKVDSEVSVETPEGEAFGPYDVESIVTVPREDFPEDLELEKGHEITVGVGDPDDEDIQEEIEAVVVEVNDEAVILDANHPLAGKTATFRMRVTSIS
jgi:FKBP-type peptidyl-prolyl cis-trans isomerase 2